MEDGEVLPPRRYALHCVELIAEHAGLLLDMADIAVRFLFGDLHKNLVQEITRADAAAAGAAFEAEKRKAAEKTEQSEGSEEAEEEGQSKRARR